MSQRPSYKQALIVEILSFKNNVYTEQELTSLRLTMCEQLLSELVLSRGEPIQKMSSQEMMHYNEIQWTQRCDMRETYEIRVDDSVYVLDKAFVDMMRSKRSFLWTKTVITDEMLVAYCIEQNAVYERRDLVGGLI